MRHRRRNFAAQQYQPCGEIGQTRFKESAPEGALPVRIRPRLLNKNYNSRLMKNSNNKVIITDGNLEDAMRDLHDLMEPGYISVDYTDIDVNGQRAVIISAVTEGEDRMSDALGKIRNSSVWDDFDLNSATKILVKIICNKDGNHQVRAEEIQEITAFMSKLPGTIDVKWSVGNDTSLGEAVKVIVFVSSSK